MFRRPRPQGEAFTFWESRLPDLALRVVDHARAHGRVTMGDAVTLTGASRNTLKEHLRMLVERRYLVQHEVGRGAWYSLS